MPDLKYANIDTRALGVAVRSDAGWWVWGSPTPSWTLPLNKAVHVLACTPDPDEPTLQTAIVTASALVPGCVLIDQYQAGSQWIAWNTLNTPENYLASGAGRASLTWRF